MPPLQPRPRDLLIAASIALAACVLPALASSADEPPPSPRKAAQDDLKKLQGTWQCVSMEREGEEVPPEAVKGTLVQYEDDRVTLYREGEIFRRGIVTLDPMKSPKKVNTWDLSGPYEDQTVPGIYDVDGETLRLCFSRPGAERPTEFSSKKAPGFLSCVYKRKKP